MAGNVSDISFQDAGIPIRTVEYICITWDDLKFVALVVGVVCILLGYAINELYHRSHGDK